MKITIKRTEDQLALVKAMGSNNREEAYEAQAAVADLMGPVINEVINNAQSIGNLFSTMTFGADDNPSIPLDLFYDITDEDFITVYSQQVAGGLPYSQVFPAHNELKFSTYTLDSAFAFDKKYVRKSRLDVVSKTFTRMAQEILLKQEKSAFNVLASALVRGDTKIGATAAAMGNHIIGSTVESQFTLDDFNRLITRCKRISASFSGGTPVGGARVGVTDIMVSPEMVQELRAMAYQPVNTRQATSGTTSIAGTDEFRNQLYAGAGLPSFYGINIIEILELGVGQRFNKVFDAMVTANGATVIGGGNSGTFSQTADEILIGIDRTRESLVRPVVLGEDTSAEFSIMVDDQFTVRQNKVGYYGKLEEGRVCLDDRALVGIVV
jgi:hypothetical protein